MKAIIVLYLSTLIYGIPFEKNHDIYKKEIDFYVDSPVSLATEQYKTLEEFKILYFSCMRQLKNNRYPQFCFEIYHLYENLLSKHPTFKTYSKYLDEYCHQNQRNTEWHSKLLSEGPRNLPAKCLKIKEEYKKMYLYQKAGLF